MCQRLSRNSPYSLEEFRNLEDHGCLQALCCHFTIRNVLSFGKNEEIYGRIYLLKWVGHNAYSRRKTIEWAVHLGGKATILSQWSDIWNVSYIELRIQYMKHFIYHFTSILHGVIRTHKWPDDIYLLSLSSPFVIPILNLGFSGVKTQFQFNLSGFVFMPQCHLTHYIYKKECKHLVVCRDMLVTRVTCAISEKNIV